MNFNSHVYSNEKVNVARQLRKDMTPEAKTYVTQEWYQGNREKYFNESRLKQLEHFRAELKEALKEYNFSKAENLYRNHLEDIDDQWHFEESKFYTTKLSKCYVRNVYYVWEDNL